MGFFSKIKSAVGQVTGKAANVQMQLSELQVKRGDNIQVALTVNATGQLNAKGVFVEIVGTETLQYQYQDRDAGDTMTHTQTGTKFNETYRRRDALLAGGLTMNPGESREFTGTIQLPPNVQPTYMGVEARHEWKVRGLVDVSMGADPDAEVEIFVI